ncbi:MAG TPA: alpha/beta hydrolase [Rhodocyclaceae bacterium]|nr:alpha/beta hydrolase [Rhodocyclaceae bacterium]
MRVRCASLLLAACLVLIGCASPLARTEAIARAATAQRFILAGGGFRLLAYYGAGFAASSRLHIYIDHDGRPWRGRQVSDDPTPHDPLALRLMVQDRTPALYLGRPCHFGLDPRPPCNAWLWTHGRYGEEVVAAMAGAITAFVRERGFGELVLIGHSGGGTLAVLLAERLERTVALVTLAANLDIDAWAAMHGYTPLAGSLNPASRAPLPPSIAQLHYVGSADRNVPPALVRDYARRQAAAPVVEVPGFDHACCWVSAWPELLERAPLRKPGR